MPRDSSGVFSLPSGYLATTGETVLASQHNSPLEDIRDALTNSLPRNGAAPMTAALKMGASKITGLADGAAATDAAAFGQLGYLKHIPEVIKTDDYTLTSAEAGKAVVANKATAITFTLPAVASIDTPYLVRNIGAGDLTVDGNASEEIEGATTLVLKTGDAALIWPNGTLWRAFRSIRQQTTTDNTIPRFDGTDGAIQTTGIVVADTSNDVSGIGQITQTATGANTIPKGTTAQRPTAAEGMFRYNTTLDRMEFYDGSSWRTIMRQTWDFESSEQAIDDGTVITIAHGLGATPTKFRVVLRCKTADNGWAVGSEVEFTSRFGGDMYTFGVNSTNAYIGHELNAQPFMINPSTGAVNNIDAADWRWVVYASL